MTKKLTISEIYKYCENNNLDKPIINQIYRNNSTPIKFICSKHGEYSQCWSRHKNGSTGCKICRYNKTSKSNRLSWNFLVETCKSKGYDIPLNKSEYKNQNSLMTFKCGKHDIYKQRLDSHMQGKIGCKKCELIRRQHSKQKWNVQKMCSYCKEHNLDLPMTSQKYIITKTKYIFICPIHGEYRQTWEKHKDGQGCPKCRYIKISNKKTKTPKYYYQECIDKGVDLPIEDYKGDSTKINHKCMVCGNVYKQTPSNHLRGQGCPKCKESHGERFIRNYLDTKHIKYIPQKKFNDLKDKSLLSYDFYLPEQKVLIEYQGLQHYESRKFNGKDNSDLKKQQYHDKLKKDYAKNNGYKLLELHYSLDTQEKVSNYLDREIY